MSVFEAVMLICFGASWPMAIYKTYKTKNPVGKSVPFLYLVLTGYIAGCIHKVYYSYDNVFWLYVLNASMVFFDLLLTIYYIRRNERLLDPANK
jgi:FtsH-binding integral membrane protein